MIVDDSPCLTLRVRVTCDKEKGQSARMTSRGLELEANGLKLKLKDLLTTMFPRTGSGYNYNLRFVPLLQLLKLKHGLSTEKNACLPKADSKTKVKVLCNVSRLYVCLEFRVCMFLSYLSTHLSQFEPRQISYGNAR
jgi:hypothetical protein